MLEKTIKQKKVSKYVQCKLDTSVLQCKASGPSVKKAVKHRDKLTIGKVLYAL